MKVVILAHENDNHTAHLKWGLEQASCQAVCKARLAWNEKQGASAAYDETDRRWRGGHPVERGGGTICKPFFPHVWQKSDGGLAATETFELTADQLPADEILTWAPAIYQEMVVKKYDVRMVLMGNNVYSYALHNPKNALDWRQDAGQGLVEVEIIKTPAAVEKAVLEFARRAGVCFGSLDFAIDNRGELCIL